MRNSIVVFGFTAFILAIAPFGQAHASWHGHAPNFSGELRDVSILRNMRPAPSYEFATAEGEKKSLADFSGKVVFLNIWATWCPPCVKEMPSLDRFQAKLGGQDFEVIALSLDQSADLVKRFYEEFKLTNLGIYMGDQKAMAAFAVGGLPTTFVIGPRGNILGALAGPADWDSEEAEVFAQYFIDNGKK